MTDRYARIRKALAMGPTPGPWQDFGPIGAGKLIKAPERLIAVGYGPNINPASEANAHLIAACDPDTIRALLAERDAIREALEDIRSRSSMNLAMNPNPFELTAMLGDIHQIADAAMAKGGEA